MIVIDGFQIDLAVREEHSHPSEVTKIPVEEGSEASDHIRAMNDIVTIEGIVSDTPIGDVEAIRFGAIKPSEQARDALINIRDERQPVDIVTSRAMYESMAMTGLVYTDTPDNGGGIFFTATFEKHRVVKVERVPVAVPRANDSTGLGHRPVNAYWMTTGKANFTNLPFWLDPDLEVFVNPRGPGPGSLASGDFEQFFVWRKNANYSEKTRLYTTTKGPLRDGFFGTDEQMRQHVINLTPAQRQGLIPPNVKGSKERAASDAAKQLKDHNSKLRVDDAGNVFTISDTDPRWKTTKPFVPKH